jgi:hypothetical protein
MRHHDVDLLAYRDLDGRSGESRSTSATRLSAGVHLLIGCSAIICAQMMTARRAAQVCGTTVPTKPGTAGG